MSRLDEYCAGLRGKRILVAGLGVSNQPLVRVLLAHGLDVTGLDRRAEPDEALRALAAAGLRLHLGEDYLTGVEGDVVFRTPGLHPDKLAPLLAGGAALTSEMEAFLSLCPCPVIGVTGSDGKTTTTTLISEMLRAAGRRVWVGGNIGTPLFDRVDEIDPGDIAVLELSSFQLLTMTQSPARAVVTNLAPNHLDIHRDMAEYVAAKENIFRHQGPSGRVVLNADNALTAACAGRAPGEVVWFSRRGPVEAGVWCDGEVIRRPDGSEVLRCAEILLPGVHNVENYMAAICAVEGLVPDAAIRQVAQRFGGVEHRIELVREKDGVRYYNDSIASSPSRTIAGLRSFDQKVILIAGGADKHIPYDVLGPELVAHVKAMVLTGPTAAAIRAAAEHAPGYAPGAPAIYEKDGFREAVEYAAALARPGDVVILSPASTSFDRFRNFAERGNVFKQIIKEL